MELTISGSPPPSPVSNSFSPLSLLPLDILALFFKLLPFWDVFVVSRVCSAFRKLALDDTTLWTAPAIGFGSNTSVRCICNSAGIRAVLLRSQPGAPLELTLAITRVLTPAEQSILRSVAGRIRTLTVFTKNTIVVASCGLFAGTQGPPMPALRTLIVNDTTEYSSAELFDLRRLPNSARLAELTTPKLADWSAGIPQLAALRKLTLCIVTTAEIKFALLACPALADLHVIALRAINPASLFKNSAPDSAETKAMKTAAARLTAIRISGRYVDERYADTRSSTSIFELFDPALPRHTFRLDCHASWADPVVLFEKFADWTDIEEVDDVITARNERGDTRVVSFSRAARAIWPNFSQQLKALRLKRRACITANN